MLFFDKLNQGLNQESVTRTSSFGGHYSNTHKRQVNVGLLKPLSGPSLWL